MAGTLLRRFKDPPSSFLLPHLWRYPGCWAISLLLTAAAEVRHNLISLLLATLCSSGYHRPCRLCCSGSVIDRKSLFKLLGEWFEPTHSCVSIPFASVVRACLLGIELFGKHNSLHACFVSVEQWKSRAPLCQEQNMALCGHVVGPNILKSKEFGLFITSIQLFTCLPLVALAVWFLASSMLHLSGMFDDLASEGDDLSSPFSCMDSWLNQNPLQVSSLSPSSVPLHSS